MKYIEEQWIAYRKRAMPPELQDDDALQVSKEHYFAGAADVLNILFTYAHALSLGEKQDLIRSMKDEIREFDQANRTFWNSGQ